MEKSIIRSRIGLLGVGLLIVSYVRLFAFRFLTPAWSIAILVVSILAIIAFIIAAPLASKWWYSGTLFSILSALILLTCAWG